MLLIIICLYLGIVNGSLSRVSNSLQFKGFIYPYAIYLQTPVNSVQKVILFQKVSSEQIYPNLTYNDLQYLEKYKHLESFVIPGNFSIQPTIIVKDNLFIVKEQKDNHIWTTTYLKSPHQHKYYEYHNASDSPKRFLNFFKIQQQKSEEKFQGIYFHQVSELWRSWVFVQYYQNTTASQEKQFKLKIKRQPSNSMLEKQFLFVKQYFCEGQVRDVILQKHPSRLMLQLLIISDYKICVFHINNQLNINFRYCTQKKDRIKKVSHLKYINIVIFYQNQILNQTKSLNSTSDQPQQKIQIQSLQQHTKSSCSVIVPPPKKGYYHIKKILRNRIVYCSTTECNSYNFRCEPLFGIQQQISRIDNIYYERIEHPYLQFIYSMVVIETNHEVFNFVECDDPKLLIPYLKLCRKSKTRINNFVTELYANLSCHECSSTPKAYFMNQSCQFIPNHQIQYFPQEVYQDKQTFLLHYSKYLAGITSTCEPRLQCTLQNYYAYSYALIKQSDDSIINSSCQLLVPVYTHSQFVIETPHNSQFSIKFCISQNPQSSISCIAWNTPQIKKRFVVKARNYILLVFTAKSGGPNSIQYQITNIEQQKIHKVNVLLKRILVFMFSVITIVILVLSLKNRVKAQLTSWGWIQYTPSGNYPLLQSQLKLKIKYNFQKGYLKQYTFHSLSNLKTQQVLQTKQCVFCLQQFVQNDQIFQIYCRHQFHKSCLSEWFQLQPNSDKCPICKRQFIQQNVSEFISGNYQFNKKMFQVSANLQEV